MEEVIKTMTMIREEKKKGRGVIAITIIISSATTIMRGHDDTGIQNDNDDNVVMSVDRNNEGGDEDQEG
jgi:hypothetical protein